MGPSSFIKVSLVGLLCTYCSGSTFVGETKAKAIKGNSGDAAEAAKLGSSATPSVDPVVTDPAAPAATSPGIDGILDSKDQVNTGTPTQASPTIDPNGDITIDGGVTGITQPIASWVCGLYPFDPSAHAIPLTQGFIPSISSGYRLAIRPASTHCTGISLKVKVTGDTTGTSAILPCRGSLCSAGDFVVGIGSKDTWDIMPDDLKTLAGNISYTLSFEWTNNVNVPGSTCFGSWRGGYGVAFSLTRAIESIPASTAAECAAFNTAP